MPYKLFQLFQVPYKHLSEDAKQLVIDVYNSITEKSGIVETLKKTASETRIPHTTIRRIIKLKNLQRKKRSGQISNS